MGLFSKKEITPKNIIISRIDKIGDLVLSIPSFVMVRKMYPQAKIYALVRNYNAPIIKGLKEIDEVISIDDYSKSELDNKILSLKADTFIALFSNNQTLHFARVSKAEYRIGPLSKPLSFFVYNYGLKQKRSKSIKNEAEYNLDLVRHLNPALYDSLSLENRKISYSNENHEYALSFLKANDISNKFILIHAFSGGSTKNFTLMEYALLIEEIAKIDSNIHIVLSSSEADKEYAYKLKELSKYKNVFIFVNNNDLLNLVSLIDKCSVYIGTGTGPTHIAGNLKKKAVCIYPVIPTLSPTRWGLFGNDNVEYIQPDINNPNEDYSKKTFDRVDSNIIRYMAEKVVEKYNE